MPILAQLGAAPDDGRVQRACAHLLSLIPEDGRLTFPGIQGYNLWALARFGCADDPHFRRACRQLVEQYRLEDGTRPGRLRWQVGACFGKHTCFMAVAKMTWLLTELVGRPGFPWAESLLRDSVEFILQHRVYLSSHDTRARPIRDDWTHFGFPLLYDTDALDLLAAVCRAGAGSDERVIPAVRLVLSKQTPDGRWLLDHSHNPSDAGAAVRAKFVGNRPCSIPVDIERRGEPSKWVTLKALQALAGVPEAHLQADVEVQAPEPPPRRLSARRPSASPEAQARQRQELLAVGAGLFLEATLEAGRALGLKPSWGGEMLFLGPDHLPEWMAVRPVLTGGTWARARERKTGWRWRVMFMLRRGALTPEQARVILGLPKGQTSRIRVANWDREFQEMSVDFLTVGEMRALPRLLARALATITPADTTYTGGRYASRG
jgi:hypothetical protein